MTASSGSNFGCLWMALPPILLFAAAPLLSVLLSTSIAENAGCTIHEGSANSCIVFGAEVGGTLYAMFVAGWLSFITLPIGFAALLAWLLAALLMWLRRKPKPRESA